MTRFYTSSTTRLTKLSLRIPFFYEPNFDAFIQPLAAIDRLSLPKDSQKLAKEGIRTRNNVVYGNFLTQKVAGNFSDGKGKYD
jgi:isopenicillin N synthase-like dioxygenase